jgi:hypothetical protein
VIFALTRQSLVSLFLLFFSLSNALFTFSSSANITGSIGLQRIGLTGEIPAEYGDLDIGELVHVKARSEVFGILSPYDSQMYPFSPLSGT